MITIGCSQKKNYVSKILLDEVISWLKLAIDSLHIDQFVYENSGEYKQLHWHGIVTVKKHFRFKPFSAFGAKHITGNTYIIHWSKIRSMFKAKLYLLKDLKYQTQEDIFINNYYSVNRFNESYLT